MTFFETQVLENAKYHFLRIKLHSVPDLGLFLCWIFLPEAPGLLNFAGDAAYL